MAPSGLAVALGQPESDGRVVARPHRTSPQEQGHRRARRQTRPDRLGSPAFRRDLCEGGTAGGGLNEIDRCGSPAAAASDVCGRWTRDGLTVDPAPWNPGLKYGARRRKFYEGQGCAELHLGRGTTPRPDTLAQTGQITRKSCLRTGRAIRCLKNKAGLSVGESAARLHEGGVARAGSESWSRNARGRSATC